MNANPFANGSVIFTQNGHYAREFARHTDGGMVGVNVGIPVPVGMLDVYKRQAVYAPKAAYAVFG